MTKRKLGSRCSRVRWRRSRSAGATAAFAGDNDSGFKTAQPAMLTPVMAGVAGHAAPDRRGRASERVSLRGHPGRDLAAHAGPGEGRPLREPRDEQGAVPVQHGRADRGQRRERLRQRAGEPADPQPALRRACSTARSSSRAARGFQRFCSNYLATSEGGIRSRHPLHERGVAGLRAPARGFVAARDRRPGRGGERRRRRARRQDGQAPPDLRDGPAQPREQRRDSRVRRPRRPLGRRHVHERSAHGRARTSARNPALPGPVPAQSQLYSYIAPSTDACWPTRATSGRSSPTRRA